MEEFVENFNDFKDWLYDNKNSTATIEQVIAKFEELGLDNAF